MMLKKMGKTASFLNGTGYFEMFRWKSN